MRKAEIKGESPAVPTLRSLRSTSGRRLRAALAGAGLLVLAAGPATAASPHPLDALSADEITRAVAVLREAGYVDAEARFPLINLKEPPKAEVLAWQEGGPRPGRQAALVVKRGAETYEAVVDLAQGTVARWELIEGVQPSILLEEWISAQELTVADPDWQAAMRKRGYTSFDNVFCAPLSAGYFGLPEEEGRRLLKVPCFDTAGTRNNIFGRPIEGLTAVVDLNAREVVEVIDTGVVPVSPDIHAYDEASQPSLRPALRPVLNGPVDGGNVRIEGGRVAWDKWDFHLRMDRRVGPVLSLVGYQDGERRRSILYQGFVSEMFVPYMDPDVGWAFRSYMDVGEYGFGLLASPLEAGTDCPQGATFLDATLADDTGAPFEAASVICIFERNTGSPLWRHAEMINETHESRPEVELVVRTIPTVGNYDYVVDWVFTQKGEIRVDVGATGIDAVKGVASRTMDDPTAAADTAYGALVAPNLAAIYHDHYLSFRLDLDVDGPVNRFVRERLVRQAPGGDSLRRSLWTIEEVPMAAEGMLARGHGPEIWRVVNPAEKTRLGHHPGIEIEGGHGAVSLLAADDYPQRRAAFSAAPLWITAYAPDELYAAGAYPNQSRGGDGLPAYVADGASVQEADVVAWYTMGFHHVTRAEDWPILPTKWHSFKLRPYNFFDRNPALDVPRAFAAGAQRAAEAAKP